MWFPDKNDPNLERLADMVFSLRRDVFRLEHYERAQEGVWEDEERGRRREQSNEERLMKWDNETRRMILGE